MKGSRKKKLVLKRCTLLKLPSSWHSMTSPEGKTHFKTYYVDLKTRISLARISVALFNLYVDLRNLYMELCKLR